MAVLNSISLYVHHTCSLLIHLASALFIAWTPATFIVIQLFLLVPLYTLSCLIYYLTASNPLNYHPPPASPPPRAASSPATATSTNLPPSSAPRRRATPSPPIESDPLFDITDRLDRLVVTPPPAHHTPSLQQHTNTLQYRKFPLRKLLAVLNFIVIWLWAGLVAWIVFVPYLFHDVTATHFVRLGHTTSTSIKLSVRYTKPTSSLSLLYKSNHTDEVWSVFSFPKPPSRDLDFIIHAQLDLLLPNTTYLYTLADGTEPVSGIDQSSFRTAFAPESATHSSLSITFGSCILQNTPWIFEHGVRGFRDILNQPALQPRSDILLFLGDFIYSDVPWSFGNSVESYRWYYKSVISVPEVRQVLQSIPSYFTYDDHEIRNNWSSGDTLPFPSAQHAYTEYLGSSNPPILNARGAYYNFTSPPVCTFMLDTRRFRDLSAKTMLGRDQLDRLKQWLVSPMPCNWRIIASSVPMTTNFRNVDKDTWGEYLDERNAILQYIHDYNVKNVVVVSGDRHDTAIQELNPFTEVVEFSVSPITNFYMPISVYTPANGDVLLYKASMGPVRVGRLEFTWNRLRFHLWDGDRICWTYEKRAL